MCHHLDGVHSPSLQPTEHCAGGSRRELLRSGATAGDCSHCVPSDGRPVVRQCGRGPCDSDGRVTVIVMQMKEGGQIHINTGSGSSFCTAAESHYVY